MAIQIVFTQTTASDANRSRSLRRDLAVLRCFKHVLDRLGHAGGYEFPVPTSGQRDVLQPRDASFISLARQAAANASRCIEHSPVGMWQMNPRRRAFLW